MQSVLKTKKILGVSIKGFALSIGLLIVAGSAKAEAPITDTQADLSKLPALASFKDCDACPDMVVMPPGSFMMGARREDSRNPFDFYGESASNTKRAPGEINIIPSEHPRHKVEMDIPFAMARTETTLAEWMACVDDGGCSHVPDTKIIMLTSDQYLEPMHPVVDVSYLDMQDYLVWLNSKVGANVYRLPTEAEWEYAARAGTETRYAQGDDLTADQANFSRKSTELILGKEFPMLVERSMPVRVDELDAANGWGLRHMSGNVDEMTMSCWSDKHLGFAADSAYLAHALSEVNCERRVSKGGSFGTSMDGIRPAARMRPKETTRRNFIGFRVVRKLGLGG